MLDNNTPTASGRGRRFDWIAIYEGWKRGRSAQALAREHGLGADTVALRCGWIDQNFPPGAPARLLVSFARRLDEAHQVLERGETVEAERRARALTALIRAARALEEWTMEQKSKPASALTAEADREDELDLKSARAALEGRLDAIARTLGVAPLSGDGAPRGDDGPASGLESVEPPGSDAA